MRINHQSLIPAAAAVLRQVRPIKNWDSVQTPGTFIKEFGAHFAEGDVPAGSIVEWRKSNGTVLVAQHDNRATWSDGSLKDASVAVVWPTTIIAGSSDTLKGYKTAGSWNNASWTTIAALTGRDLRLEVTLATASSQQVGTGTGTLASFTGTLAGAPLRPGTVTISWQSTAGTKAATDNGSGGWQAAAWVAGGSINYTTGVFQLNITTSPNYAPLNGTAVTATYLTTANMGTTYTLGANNEVARGTNITQDRSGPVSAGWRIFGELRNGAGGNATPEGDVWGFLYPTFFNDGTFSLWGTIENGKFTKSTATSKIVIDYSLKDYSTNTTLFDYSSPFTLYAGCPVYCNNTDGLHYYSGPSVDKCVVAFPILSNADPTTKGLYDSAACWWNTSTPAMIAALTTSTSATYVPNTSADFSNVNGTGGHNWVGVMTYQATAAMLSGSWSALRADRVNALAWAPNQGSFLDPTVGYPGNLTDGAIPFPGLGVANKAVGWGSTPSITITGGAPAGPGATPSDGSHAPLYAWFQYLATGQEPWLDMLLNNTIGNLGWPGPQVGAPSVPGGRNAIINGVAYNCVFYLGNQCRGLAWNLRNGGNTEWVLPDNHPMKPYIQFIMTNTFNAMAAFVQPPNQNASAATLGIFASNETSGAGYVSGWMHDFLLLSAAMQIRRGRLALNQGFVTYHLIPWVLGRQVGGCPWACTSEELGIGIGASPPNTGSPPFGAYAFPQQWSDVYYGVPSKPLMNPVTTGPSGGSCPVSGLNPISDVWNFNSVGNGYAAILLAANVAGVITGMGTNATTGYAYMQAQLLANHFCTEAAWAAPLSAQWRLNLPTYVPA